MHHLHSTIFLKKIRDLLIRSAIYEDLFNKYIFFIDTISVAYCTFYLDGCNNKFFVSIFKKYENFIT
ncbi:hypothetical protein DERP_000034 [Dermatophagoides pteronyssinus]|uniref:Uncharacterized protein n=1 Tax=Dermatophagoides pteronyssinus TaxID=6956 RepID=A0ABQ8IZ40_DERPT|nr:hypothetical protein DERP_000034 [Dermatophagoides pteronyssinus]